MNALKIGIIGANGFIGKHLTGRLVNEPGIDLFLAGRGKNRSGFDAPYFESDPENKEFIKGLQNTDVLYYLASQSIPSSSWDFPTQEIENNLLPFLKLLEKCKEASVKKVVFLSSAGTVYGPSTTKIRENSETQPFSPYGITKLTMEHFLNYYRIRHGTTFDIFRISNVYGEGQDTSKGLGLINTFIEKIITEKKVRIYGDGKNLRNYIYIGDVVELLAMSLKGRLNESGTFNLSSDDALSINQIVEVLRSVVDVKFDVEYVDGRKSDVDAIDPDNTKIKELYKDFKFTPIMDGIRRTYNHLKHQKLSH